LGKALLAFVVLYGLSSVILSRIAVNKNPKAGTIPVFVRTNGVHTDIVVPARTAVIDWTEIIRYEHTQVTDTTAAYLGFGWGDRDFYLNTPNWSDLKLKTAFNAAFYLGTSAVHTEYEIGMAESGTCRKMMLTEPDYRRLVFFIRKSLKQTKDGRAVWIKGSGYGASDTFYEGMGRYSLFKTCNTWTNEALKAANQKAAVWAITEDGVMRHHRSN
jgi:uncharacterized protein (TIGR02117 family)